MTQDPLDTSELKKKLGVESEPEVYTIEKGMVKQFVRAIGDPNPLWQDEEYARKSRYGTVIAPPAFIPLIGFGQGQQSFTPIPGIVNLHSSTELECYQPVRVGDTVTVTTKLADLRERQRKTGKMAFLTWERNYKNQRQELVAICRQTVVSYQAEAKHD